MLYDIRFGHLRCLGDLDLVPNEVTCKSPFTEGLLTQNPKCRRQLRERLKAGREKADGIGDSLVYRSPHICTGGGMHSNLHLRSSFCLRRARAELGYILVARETDLCFTVILQEKQVICSSPSLDFGLIGATGQSHPKCCQGLTLRGTLVRKWPLKVMRFVGKPG